MNEIKILAYNTLEYILFWNSILMKVFFLISGDNKYNVYEFRLIYFLQIHCKKCYRLKREKSRLLSVAEKLAERLLVVLEVF